MVKSTRFIFAAGVTATLYIGLPCSQVAHCMELRGQLDVGLHAADARPSWERGGLGKLPDDQSSPTGRLALRGDTDVVADLVAAFVMAGGSRPDEAAGLQEAWIGWHPVPKSPWRIRAKAGAFLPVTSLEVGYDSVGWTADRTISSSAINSWIGEEIRIKGAELEVLRRGVFAGSLDSFGGTVGVFAGNDPAGTLLAWRGWDLSGSVASLTQGYRLPDLPVYRPNGAIPIQTRDIHVFREIDNRLGHYESVNYSYSNWLDLAAMHYDNRADPLRIEQRQYGWHTRFDHLSVRLQLPRRWELMAQEMRGNTLMGPNAVHLDFSSWYVLASHPAGLGLLTIRYDEFRTVDRDMTPLDPNGETGNAWALAFSHPLPHSLRLVIEALRVDSDRPARVAIGEVPREIDRSLSAQLRWTF